MRVDCIVQSINNSWWATMEHGSQINAICMPAALDRTIIHAYGIMPRLIDSYIISHYGNIL